MNLIKLFTFIFTGIAVLCSLMMDLNRANTIPGGRSVLLETVEKITPSTKLKGSEEEDSRIEVRAVSVNGGTLYNKVKELYEAGIIPRHLPQTMRKKLKLFPVIREEKTLFAFIKACAEKGFTFSQFDLPAQGDKIAPEQLPGILYKITNSLYHISDFSLHSTYTLTTDTGHRMQLHWINSDFARMSEAVQSMLNVASKELNNEQSTAWEPMWLHLNVEEIRALKTALDMLKETVKKADSADLRARKLHDALIGLVEYHNLKDEKSVFYQNRNKFVIYAMQGNAICEGYAQAYGFLLNLAGVQSQRVSGIVYDSNGQGCGHAWNMVKGSQGWRHVDVTWDDNGNKARYTYFMVTDDTMKDKAAGARNWAYTYEPHVKQ